MGVLEIFVVVGVVGGFAPFCFSRFAFPASAFE